MQAIKKAKPKRSQKINSKALSFVDDTYTSKHIKKVAKSTEKALKMDDNGMEPSQNKISLKSLYYSAYVLNALLFRYKLASVYDFRALSGLMYLHSIGIFKVITYRLSELYGGLNDMQYRCALKRLVSCGLVDRLKKKDKNSYYYVLSVLCIEEIQCLIQAVEGADARD